MLFVRLSIYIHLPIGIDFFWFSDLNKTNKHHLGQYFLRNIHYLQDLYFTTFSNNKHIFIQCHLNQSFHHIKHICTTVTVTGGLNPSEGNCNIPPAKNFYLHQIMMPLNNYHQWVSHNSHLYDYRQFYVIWIPHYH